MGEHPNLGVLKQSYEAIATGDADYLSSIAADTFTFEVSGTSAISGIWHSVDEALAEMGRAMEMTGGTMAIQPRYLLADDEIGIALLDVTASRPDGRQIEQLMIHEWDFNGGKVSGVREWIWDQAADVEFWA